MRRLGLRAAVGGLLLAIAAAGVAYPLWWNHRSSSAGQVLLQRALPVRGTRFGAGTVAAGCSTGRGVGSAAASTQHPGVLAIPILGLLAPVLQGLSNSVLDVAVGHDPATVWPGQHGESLLLAHDVSYFAELSRLRPGDRVSWQVGCAQAIFRVTATTVTRPGVAIAAPRSGSGLALITCWPTNALFWTSDRFVVQSELVSRWQRSSAPPVLPARRVQLRVPAPPALAAEGLSLAQTGIPVGRLAFAGSPSATFGEGPQPLEVEEAALRDYAAAAKTAAAGNRSWWSSIAVAGLPLPAAWSLAHHTDVTLVVSGSTVQEVIVTSPVVTVTLTNRNGVLLVVGVRAAH